MTARTVVMGAMTAFPALAAFAFLDGRAEPPPRTGKEEAMALMAGWFSSRYSEGFFEAVWEDELVAAELERRLRSTATFEAFELVAS